MREEAELIKWTIKALSYDTNNEIILFDGLPCIERMINNVKRQKLEESFDGPTRESDNIFREASAILLYTKAIILAYFDPAKVPAITEDIKLLRD